MSTFDSNNPFGNPLNGTYVYANPLDYWKKDENPFSPYVPPSPAIPGGPQDAEQKTIFLEHLCDEFDIMRAISKLDDAAKQRILSWLMKDVAP